jgi:cation:H+ antiporter
VAISPPPPRGSNVPCSLCNARDPGGVPEVDQPCSAGSRWPGPPRGIVTATGLAAGFVGAVLLAVVNALPETVTSLAAVRRGALTLAIAAILGGNCLDALNVVVGDVFYRGGSLYHAPTADSLFLTVASVLMTVVVVAGLLVRQGRGVAKVGFEGVLLLGIYASIILVLAV